MAAKEPTQIKEQVTPSAIQKKLKNWRNVVQFMILMLICSWVTLFVINYLHSEKIKKSQGEVVDAGIRIMNRNEKITVLEDKLLEVTTLHVNSIAMVLKLTNTPDELMVRDIQLFIKFKYPRIPRSVTEDIAINTVKYGKNYDIDPILIIGIMKVESVGFNPMSTGPKTKYGNARGLMQVMPEWVPKFKLKDVHDLYDIDINIESGCKVFNIHLTEAKGSIAQALYLYVNKDKEYVVKVYKAMGEFVAFRSTVDEHGNILIGDLYNGNGKEKPQENVDEPAKTDD